MLCAGATIYPPFFPRISIRRFTSDFICSGLPLGIRSWTSIPLGIYIVGLAGIRKDKELSSDEKTKHIKEFNLRKGVAVAIFSNIWGLILKEWKGAGKRTLRTILTGIIVLIFATMIIGGGSFIKKKELNKEQTAELVTGSS
jgi:hypothetical protein